MSEENTDPDSTEAVENESTDVVTPDGAELDRLRAESAAHQQRAREHAERLQVELVRATGLLIDPTDLPFDEKNLTDPDALTAAVHALIDAKPHLRARKVAGDAGQGPRGDAGPTGPQSFADLLRN